MPSVHELHQQAMDLAEEAFIQRRRGNYDTARTLFLESLHLEQTAAEQLIPARDNEPSRSILYRSAASLALNGEDFNTASNLVQEALRGYPPPEIHEELWSVYEDARFALHLRSRHVELDKRQGVFSLSGNGVASDLAPSDQLLTRFDKLRTLIFRTAERLLDLPYRIAGGTEKAIREYYELYIRAMQPGTFSVSFQIGKPDPQLSLFPQEFSREPISPSAVVAEVLNCLSLFEDERIDELHFRIPDAVYYDNFVGLAKEIAPDGTTINRVGIYARDITLDSVTSPVLLRRSRNQIRETLRTQQPSRRDGDSAIYSARRGILRYANTPVNQTSRSGKVKLRDQISGDEITLSVPVGLMKDVVQPYYGERVVVHVREENKKLYLEEISLDTGEVTM